MNAFRLVLLVSSSLALGGAGYLAYNGAGASADVVQSVRVGSGGPYSSSSVK